MVGHQADVAEQGARRASWDDRRVLNGICCDPAHHGTICRIAMAHAPPATTVSSVAAHDAAVRMIDTSVVRVHQHAATRYYKLAADYLAFIQLASTSLWLRFDAGRIQAGHDGVGSDTIAAARENLPPVAERSRFVKQGGEMAPASLPGRPAASSEIAWTSLSPMQGSRKTCRRAIHLLSSPCNSCSICPCSTAGRQRAARSTDYERDR